MHRQIDFTDAQQVMGFVVPQLYNIEAQVAEIQYPSYTFEDMVPVVTEGDPWAVGTVFYSGDIAGTAQYLSGKGFDMPYVELARSQYLKQHHLAGVGFEWTLEEMKRAVMAGRDMPTEKAAAAKQVAQQFKFYSAMLGRTPDQTTSEKNQTGLLNDPNVPVATSPTAFATSTPDQILAIVNGLIEGVHTGSQEVEMSDTVVFPFVEFSRLSRTRTGSAGDSSIMQFLRQNNSYTAETGQPLLIKTMRLLNGAGTGGTNRMMAYKRDPNIVRFHLPMDHEFLPPFQKSSMTWEMAGIMRIGGTEFRRPRAAAYLDGI